MQDIMLESRKLKAIDELKAAIDNHAYVMVVLGYDYFLAYKAPETFEDLKECGKLIPIASHASKSNVYGEEINIELRFWNNCLHVMHDKDFSLAGELDIYKKQLETFRNWGVSKDALIIFSHSTCGQVKYYYKHKKFPNNQMAFLDTCLTKGEEYAINHPQ